MRYIIFNLEFGVLLQGALDFRVLEDHGQTDMTDLYFRKMTLAVA